MPRRLVVTVDDEVRYDGEIHDWQLPKQPEQFPAAMGLDPQRVGPPTPMAKLFALTMLTQVIMSTLEQPILQPLVVDMRLRGPGCFTLTVDTPAPEQLALDADQGDTDAEPK